MSSDFPSFPFLVALCPALTRSVGSERVGGSQRSTDPADAPSEEWREELIWDMMPDYLHPSPQGMQVIANHLLPLVQKCIRKYDSGENQGTDSADPLAAPT